MEHQLEDHSRPALSGGRDRSQVGTLDEAETLGCNLADELQQIFSIRMRGEVEILHLTMPGNFPAAGTEHDGHVARRRG